MSNHNINTGNLKREASTETICPSKQTHYSLEGVWSGAASSFGKGVLRSSSPVSPPPSHPIPSNDEYSNQNRSHARRLSGNFAAVTNSSRQNSENKENTQDKMSQESSVYVANTQGSPLGVQAGLRPRRTLSDRKNTNEAQGNQPSQISKPQGNEASNATPPSAPPTCKLRVTNADIESAKDEIASDEEEGSPLALPQIIVPSSPANAMHIRSVVRMLPRFSFRIVPREAHATFWDAHNGGKLDWIGRLEFMDTMQETYSHHAEILVRSYVEPSIRGRESADYPEFVMHYQEPPRRNDSSPTEDSSVDVAAIRAAGIASRAQATIRIKLDGEAEDTDDEERPKIKAADWVPVETMALQIWTKNFSVPIPAELFETRETRTFRVEAKISFHSKLSKGFQHNMRADTIQVSVSHLLSERELGMRGFPATRADRCNRKL